MIRKEHTRNQRRMYRIHKQDERIHDLELLVGELRQENNKIKEDNYVHVNYTNKLQRELNEENLQCSKYAIEINDLKEKYNKQVSNWNKLKEYLKSFDIKSLHEYMEHNLADTLENILYKMQEIEGSDSNVKD